MEINKARLAAGDRNEFLKLARSIRSTTAVSKTTSPIGSQFFPDDGAALQHLDLDTLVENLAGTEDVERNRWIEMMASAGYDERMKLLRPDKTADVTQIGAARSGWTPPQNVTVSTTAGKVATTVQFKKAAKATEAADTGVLVESLKAIVYQLLGVSAETFDPNTLKVKLTQALKAARPDVRTRLAKALGTAA
jgi:hypothetical protein